jgi:Fe-S cluster assembly iron-binding protein IscA
MLTITPTAATVLTKARKEKGAPDSFGVRFFATEATGSGRARLAFKFVESAEPDDTFLDGLSIDACVAPEVETLIGDVIVDAEQRDGRMGLVVRRTPQQN